MLFWTNNSNLKQKKGNKIKNMGCSSDNYCVGLKKEHIYRFIVAFNDILEDYFYSKYSKVKKDDCIIVEGENDRIWLNFENEPLFKTMEGESITDDFVEKYIKIYPKDELILNYQLSYNNCGDTTNINYTYDPKTQILSIKRIYGEDSGIYECQECDAYFEEALVYLEDYDENKQYFCPKCGEKLSLDVKVITETKKIEI